MNSGFGGLHAIASFLMTDAVSFTQSINPASSGTAGMGPGWLYVNMGSETTKHQLQIYYSITNTKSRPHRLGEREYRGKRLETGLYRLTNRNRIKPFFFLSLYAFPPKGALGYEADRIKSTFGARDIYVGMHNILHEVYIRIWYPNKKIELPMPSS